MAEKYEKAQAVLAAVQTAVLAVSVCVAVSQCHISNAQNTILQRQTTISGEQAAISKSLADLPYAVSLEATYDKPDRRIVITNHGQTNVAIWGIKLDQACRIEKEPSLIPPGSIWALGGDFERTLLVATGENGQVQERMVLLVKNARGEPYEVSLIVWAKAENGSISALGMRAVSSMPAEWKDPSC